MNIRKGTFLILCVGFLLLSACVPAEDQKAIPFTLDLQNPEIRKIYDLQQKQDRDSLVAGLSHSDPSIQFAALRAFASFQDSGSLAAIMPLLTHQVGAVRAMAAEAVGQIGLSKAEAELTAAFDGRDSARLYEPANGSILEAMGRIGSQQYLRALSTITNYKSIDTFLLLGQARGIYRYALRQMVVPEGTATMVRYLADTNTPEPVRIIAANYLHRAQGIDLTPHTAQLLATWHGESHPFLRMCLATALGKIKSPECLKVLTESLQTESDYRVKCNIIRALQQFSYDDIYAVLLTATQADNPHVAEVAAQYFVQQGRERDAARYRTAMDGATAWQAKTRMAEAANKHNTSMFSAAKTNIQKEIQQQLRTVTSPYEKAAWLKAWGSELRNFESLPKYISDDEHVAVRTQAISSLIDACRDKNFDAFFAGEGHLIRAQIGGYLLQGIRSGDAGIIAMVAEAITDPKTGLKAVMSDKRNELSKALAELKLPAEMETYMALGKALREYGVDAPKVPEEQKKISSIDWTAIDELNPGHQVRLSTSKGDIIIALYPDRAPGTVSSFLTLIRSDYYKGKTFHRVVPNFVIQTGCPRGDGYGSLDFTLRSELAGAYYDGEGYVGMASAGAHTEGTQFFITHSPAPHLDGRYTIFGRVTSGMDVVHAITIGDTITQIQIVN